TTYDLLEENVDGPLLEQLYLDIRRGLDDTENGGPQVRVLGVTIVDCRVTSGGNGGGFGAEVAWVRWIKPLPRPRLSNRAV
ncbi:MAG: hypothetical protein AAGB04_29725, partial [Pseudomonadota bacterium]